jgi:hypothetical protein
MGGPHVASQHLPGIAAERGAVEVVDVAEDSGLGRLLITPRQHLERVRVRAEGRILAEHVRVWARGTTITDPAHVETAARLRKQFQQPRAAVVERDDLTRDLSDYDRAFGLSDQEGIS